jgi:hypothetical protein
MAGPLLLVLALTVLVLPGEVSLTGPTYTGKLPAGIDGGFTARLDSTQGQYLMSTRDGMLVAFAFEHGNLVPRCSLPLSAPIAAPDGGSPLSTGRIAAAGDVDGDGSDEIVVAGSRTIRKYELIRGAFALTAEAALKPDSNTGPVWCFDVCIGDVDRDGLNEVMLSGISGPPPFEPDGVDRPITLYVCRWVNRELTVTWNDRGSLDLEGPSWVSPITEMRCVCDPTNSGHRRLLVEQGRSDVSASMFDELMWTPDGLRYVGRFVIRDGRIQWNVPDNNPAYSAIDCDFGQIGGMTDVLAGMVQEDYVWQGEYFVFSGDAPSKHRVLWSDRDHNWYSPSSGILIDLDGKGIGALRFVYSRGGPRFEFYRL